MWYLQFNPGSLKIFHPSQEAAQHLPATRGHSRNRRLRQATGSFIRKAGHRQLHQEVPFCTWHSQRVPLAELLPTSSTHSADSGFVWPASPCPSPVSAATLSSPRLLESHLEQNSPSQWTSKSRPFPHSVILKSVCPISTSLVLYCNRGAEDLRCYHGPLAGLPNPSLLSDDP